MFFESPYYEDEQIEAHRTEGTPLSKAYEQNQQVGLRLRPSDKLQLPAPHPDTTKLLFLWNCF